MMKIPGSFAKTSILPERLYQLMIELKNVRKKYGDTLALDQVNVTINDGICFGLIGPNGAGKSTLMKIIAGITQKYEGEISFNEKPLEKNRYAVKQTIGYVPQDLVLENVLSARDNLTFFGGVYGIPKNKLADTVNKTLEDIGLRDRADDLIKNFSGGMKRRLNIGCGIMHNPKLVIMDEPTVGIDPQSRNYIYTIIDKLKKDGKTIIYSSHYMEEVQNLCEDIVLIDHGKILEGGSVNSIIKKYSKPAVYLEGEGIKPQELNLFGEVAELGNGYRIVCDNVMQTMEKISSFLLANRQQVSHLEIYHMNLEDIFFLLTGKSLRDK
ncbi:ABC transporter ATP-binding protein [Desulfosporosinus sp. PR]|uniref:ABC transporter ATP-binding protein n=1 Tax=Candidatus Desulfosporosinus nitrosoreducens TaxID=3401928 RepID=UPI0027ECE78F|nr:ABC transporter ATP-binding protein [Desulfosporosinus sp. PR]MDQ7095347.1 ABC transporter ATP-binding protein [Desulfosporosinus sp. PR]